MSKQYQYEIPSETGFRNYTVYEEVRDLGPDGFIADEETGDSIVDDVLADKGLAAAGQWDTYGTDGAMRLLYWESVEDSVNDDGAKAMGQVVKTPVDSEE